MPFFYLIFLYFCNKLCILNLPKLNYFLIQIIFFLNKYINLILSLLILLAIHSVYFSLAKPIEFNKALTSRTESVKEKLKCLQKFQKYVEAKTGNFSGDLKNDLKNTTSEIMDSLNIKECLPSKGNPLGIPFSNADFVINVDTIDYQNRKKVVVEIKASYKTFMSEYINKNYSKYYNEFDPDDELSIGDLITPSIKENWQ